MTSCPSVQWYFLCQIFQPFSISRTRFAVFGLKPEDAVFRTSPSLMFIHTDLAGQKFPVQAENRPGC